MKRLLISAVVFAFAACGYAQDGPSLVDAARQKQEQKKASRTFTNDDVNGGMIESTPAPQPVNGIAVDAQTKDDADKTAAAAESEDPAAVQAKPDRSNFAGDVPGYTPEPKDRIETLKQHASQWEAIIADFEKKIAAETNSQKRDSLELMLEHARQNQAKDAAEQASLEKSEAEKANGQPEAQAGQEQQQGAQPQ